MANIITDILNTIESTLLEAGYNKVYFGTFPENQSKNFVVVSIEASRQNNYQSKNNISDVVITEYRKLYNNPSQKAIREEYEEILTNAQTNLYKLFQFVDTRVNLPHSAEIWFDETTKRIDNLSTQTANTGSGDRYMITETTGFLSVIEE